MDNKKEFQMMLGNRIEMTYSNHADKPQGHFLAPLGAGEQREWVITRQFRGEGVIARVAARRSLMMTLREGGSACQR